MKSMASGHILRSKTVSALDCLHYALSLSTSVVITGVDSKAVLDQAFEAAKEFFQSQQGRFGGDSRKNETGCLRGNVRAVQDLADF